MKKAFFFDKNSGELYKCLFAGISNDGQAQWVMVNQGKEATTLSEYQDNAIGAVDICLLCLEGQKVESQTMALLLGAVTQSYPFNLPDALAKCIRKLKAWDVSWEFSPLEMEVRLVKYLVKECDDIRYGLSISMKDVGWVAYTDNYESLNEVMRCVRCYFETLEREGIEITSKQLIIEIPSLNEMRKEDKEMFNNNIVIMG